MYLRVYLHVAALATLGGPLWAQTEINLTRQGRIESGAQLPSGCAPGQLFIKTDAAGPALYTCPAPGSWSQAVSYSAGPGIAIGGNSITMDDAVAPSYFAGAGAPSLDCAAGRDYYVDTATGALYYCKAAGVWQALSVAGHTHTAGDIASGTLSGSVMPADAVLTGRANAYASGQRQSMSHNAASAGLRLVPAGGDPSSAEDGDVWYNLTTGKFRRRQNGVNADWDAGTSAHNLLGAAHGDTTAAAASRGDLITAQGANPTWSRLPIGPAGTFLRSNGTDVSYGSIAAGDLPSGYPWTGLVNVPSSFPPSGHAAAHQNGGADEIATATPAANAIPKAGAGGALAAGWLPAPGASTLGGVNSFTAGAHQWINTISTTGAPSSTQPACGDLSNGAASCSVDTTNASNITSGTLPAGRLPAPGASTLGGVQSKDCSGAGHVLKINADGSVTCSPDSGGGGGGGVTMSAGVGKICLIEPCLGVGGGTSSTYTANRVYYFQSNIYATIPVKQILMYLKPGTAAATHYAMALMDSSCAKVPGSDINYTTTGDQYTTAAYATPVTLPPGVYYLAIVTDAAAGGVIGWQTPGVPALSNGLYSGAAPRFFYGATAPTGSGATLAVPASCGAVALATESFAPIAWLIP